MATPHLPDISGDDFGVFLGAVGANSVFDLDAIVIADPELRTLVGTLLGDPDSGLQLPALSGVTNAFAHIRATAAGTGYELSDAILETAANLVIDKTAIVNGRVTAGGNNQAGSLRIFDRPFNTANAEAVTLQAHENTTGHSRILLQAPPAANQGTMLIGITNTGEEVLVAQPAGGGAALTWTEISGANTTTVGGTLTLTAAQLTGMHDLSINWGTSTTEGGGNDTYSGGTTGNSGKVFNSEVGISRIPTSGIMHIGGIGRGANNLAVALTRNSAGDVTIRPVDLNTTDAMGIIYSVAAR